jgi:hypothetical protein
MEFKKRLKKTKTYNSEDSLVVTHPTTNSPACGLSTAERTGSPVFHTLWSYVLIFALIWVMYVPRCQTSAKVCMDRVKVILNGVNAIRNSHRDRINLLLFKAYCLTKRFAVHINTLEELRLYLKAAPMVTYQKYIFDIAKPSVWLDASRR